MEDLNYSGDTNIRMNTLIRSQEISHWMSKSLN